MSDLVYQNDANGKTVAGSVDALIAGLAAGRQLRTVVHDDVGYVAYNLFSTVRVDARPKTVVADLMVRPAMDNAGNIGAFGLSIATIDTTGRYVRFDGLGSTASYTGRYEIKWFLDKA